MTVARFNASVSLFTSVMTSLSPVVALVLLHLHGIPAPHWQPSLQAQARSGDFRTPTLTAKTNWGGFIHAKVSNRRRGSWSGFSFVPGFFIPALPAIGLLSCPLSYPACSPSLYARGQYLFRQALHDRFPYLLLMAKSPNPGLGAISGWPFSTEGRAGPNHRNGPKAPFNILKLFRPELNPIFRD